MLGSIPQQKSVPAGNHFIITRRIGDPSPRTAHSDRRSALGAYSYPSLKHGVSFERVAVNFRFSNRNRKSSNFIREFADLSGVRLGLRPDQSGKRNHGSSRAVCSSTASASVFGHFDSRSRDEWGNLPGWDWFWRFAELIFQSFSNSIDRSTQTTCTASELPIRRYWLRCPSSLDEKKFSRNPIRLAISLGEKRRTR